MSYIRLDRLESSRLYQHLQGFDPKQNVRGLLTAVERFIDQADAISGHVLLYMPQYTLHDGKHLWKCCR